MKKAFYSALLALLCIGLVVSCATPAATAEASSDLLNAKNYIYAMYKDKAVTTASDYSVVDVAMIKMVPYPVTWTAEVTSGSADAVQIIPGDNHKVTIDVNEKTPVDVAYTLTATVSDPEGNTMAVSFEHAIPAFKELTWNEYAAAAKGDTIVAKGVITGIMAKSKGNSTNCLYMQDADGGYYVYGLADDPVEAGLKIGQTVRVTGAMDIYSGTYEIASATVEVLDEGTTAIEPADWTAKYEAATSLKDAELVKEQAFLVTIKGVEVTGQDTASGYYRFKKNGLESYVRISSSVCPIEKADQTKLIADHAAHLGWTADVTGVICVYDGAFYLSPVSVDAFQYVSLPAKSDAEMVAFELDNIAIAEAVTEDTTIALPTVGAGYAQVSISWSSDNACASVDGDKVSITLPEEDTVVTLTATAKAGDVTVEKAYEVKVDGAASQLFVSKLVEAPAFGQAYKWSFFQANLGKTLYFAGEMSGNYLATTDKAEKAADITLVETEGGFYLQCEAGYVEIYDNGGKAAIRIASEPTCVWTFNSDAFVPVTEVAGAEYYLGTYKTYNTMSASKTSYILGDNLKTIGISQFPGQFTELAPAAYSYATVSSDAVEGQAYKWAVKQGNLGKTLFFTGEMSGNYLATSDKAEKAADVYIVPVEGGFQIKCENGYVEVYDNNGKAAIRIASEPSCVWTWNEEAKVPVTVVAGADYYLGTYKTYDTFSASKTSYILGDNLKNIGISQFPGFVMEEKLSEVIYSEIAEAPVEDTEYLWGFHQANLGKTLYFAGEMSGNYLATTDKVAKAASVKAVKAEGGFYLQCAAGYVEIYDNNGKAAIRIASEPTCVWTWNEEANVPVSVVAGADYYLGTYKTYDTMSASKTSYILGDNLKNIGISQFPGKFITVVVAD